MKVKNIFLRLLLAITVLFTSQAVFAGASKLLKDKCEEYFPKTRLYENVKIKSFVESFVDNEEPYITIQDKHDNVFKIKIDRYDPLTEAKIGLLDELRKAYSDGKTLNLCVNVEKKPNIVWGVEIN
ncbi:MAG: hypothetical protein REH83_07335 [Rickettsiella sp.]|nr:hypothetical protein [Rickettsiella sp.]